MKLSPQIENIGRLDPETCQIQGKTFKCFGIFYMKHQIIFFVLALCVALGHSHFLPPLVSDLIALSFLLFITTVTV